MEKRKIIQSMFIDMVVIDTFVEIHNTFCIEEDVRRHGLGAKAHNMV